MIKVAAGIIFNDGKFLVARRSAHKSMGGKWEFPGGKIEQNETPEETLIREFKEEFNITITIDHFFLDTTHDYGDFTINLVSFKGRFIEGTIKLVDHDSYLWIEVDNLNDFDWAEADIPIIQKLQSNE
jgi:8-oxo-dGTP diphosphatase